MTVSRVRLKCSVRGCPWPNDPDAHVCVARDEPWHYCSRTASHQHFPRRNHAGSRIVAILCLCLHQAIDQGFPHVGRDGVKRRLKNYVGEVWDVTGLAFRGPRTEYCIADRESGEVLLEVPL